MAEDFVAWLVLVVLPATYAVAGLWRRLGGATRALAVVAIALLLWRGLPREGLERAALLRLEFFVAALPLIVLLRRSARGSGDALDRRLLQAAAAAALLVYTNFFAFHGGGNFVHFHDVAHYYLGSRYFRELGYGSLYVAMARAEWEEYGGKLAAETARDPSTNQLVPISALLERSDPVKARFPADRWVEFRSEVRFFRERMGPRYAGIFADHEYNPTPTWALLGGSLARWMPPASDTAIGLLALLDPLLLAVVGVSIGRVFGLEAFLLATIYFCVAFGAGFSWLGGAYLRQLWFAGVVLSACALEAGRFASAGTLLAVATALRIFPGLFAFPLLARGVLRWLRTRQLPPDDARFAAGFVLGLVALFAASCIFEGGPSRWLEFAERIGVHRESLSANRLGLTAWAVYLSGIEIDGPGGLEALVARWDLVHRIQLLALFLPALAFAAIRSLRVPALEAFATGSLLLFVAENLSAYYYVFLVVGILAYRHRPERLWLFFAVECAVYGLALFEPREVLLYFYKSALLAYLFLALYGEGTGSGST